MNNNNNNNNNNPSRRSVLLAAENDDDDDDDDTNDDDTTTNNNNNANANNNNVLLSLLLEQLYMIASSGGYDITSVICQTKALNVLEATAGDIHLSAQLYWDDYLASQEHNNNVQQQQQQRERGQQQQQEQQHHHPPPFHQHHHQQHQHQQQYQPPPPPPPQLPIQQQQQHHPAAAAAVPPQHPVVPPQPHHPPMNPVAHAPAAGPRPIYVPAQPRPQQQQPPPQQPPPPPPQVRSNNSSSSSNHDDYDTGPHYHRLQVPAFRQHHLPRDPLLFPHVAGDDVEGGQQRRRRRQDNNINNDGAIAAGLDPSSLDDILQQQQQQQQQQNERFQQRNDDRNNNNNDKKKSSDSSSHHKRSLSSSSNDVVTSSTSTKTKGLAAVAIAPQASGGGPTSPSLFVGLSRSFYQQQQQLYNHYRNRKDINDDNNNNNEDNDNDNDDEEEEEVEYFPDDNEKGEEGIRKQPRQSYDEDDDDDENMWDKNDNRPTKAKRNKGSSSSNEQKTAAISSPSFLRSLLSRARKTSDILNEDDDDDDVAAADDNDYDDDDDDDKGQQRRRDEKLKKKATTVSTVRQHKRSIQKGPQPNNHDPFRMMAAEADDDDDNDNPNDNDKDDDDKTATITNRRNNIGERSDTNNNVNGARNDDVVVDVPAVAVAAAAAAAAALGNDNNNNVDNNVGGRDNDNQQHPLFPDNRENDFAEVRAAAVAAIAESVSVSDDEHNNMLLLSAASTAGWGNNAVGGASGDTTGKNSTKGSKSNNKKRNASPNNNNNNNNDRASKRRNKKQQQRINAQQAMEASKSTRMKKDKASNKNTDDDDDIDKDGYISENDWVFDGRTSRDPLPSVPPMDIVWSGIGLGNHSSISLDGGNNKSGSTTNTNDKNNNNKTSEAGCADDVGKDAGVVIIDSNDTTKNNDDNDNDSVDGDDDNNDDDPNTSTNGGIPYTWLNASFQFVCDDNYNYGLVLQPPSESDLGYSAWKGSDLWTGNARTAVPPPYHCRAVTSLISIANALLYAGVYVPGNGKLSTGPVETTTTIPVGTTRQPLVAITKELQELKTKQKLEQEKLHKKFKHSTANSKKVKLKEEEDEILLNQKRPSKKEWEGRLCDALSSLIAIAIRASVERKMKKLKLIRDSDDPDDKRRWQSIQHKLRLFPACWWDPDTLPNKNSNTNNNNDGTDNSNNKKNCKDIRITVSYTSIDDIRSYVLGNMPAFMSSGGCALFMDTIARIHGKGAILRMLKKARKEGSKVLDKKTTVLDSCGKQSPSRLISCTCDERFQQNLAENVFKKQRSNNNEKFLDTTPHSHECISIEMLSLLLTGRVYSTLQGWSTGPLGIGLLSDIPGQVGRQLTRPEKPVWILRGPTSYSCLWLNGCNDHVTTFSKVDNPTGTVANLSHWNCWYSTRKHTTLRLISDRSTSSDDDNEVNPNNTSGPKISTKFDDIFQRASMFNQHQSGGMLPVTTQSKNRPTVLEMITERRRATAEYSQFMEAPESIPPKYVVTEREMDAVTIHPDDPKFYPSNYRLWRFQLPSKEIITANDPNDIIRNCSTVEMTSTSIDETSNNSFDWRAYHRLNEREKLIVEYKLGQKINTILWTRWPNATIDKYDPEDPPAAV